MCVFLRTIKSGCMPQLSYKAELFREFSKSITLRTHTETYIFVRKNREGTETETNNVSHYGRDSVIYDIRLIHCIYRNKFKNLG